MSIDKIFLLQLIVSVFCGSLVGIERELRNKGAGFRTYILVCIGGCLAEVLSERICAISNGDPTRIAAGVVGGIGFLGSGLIMFNKSELKGVTSATDIWCMAIIGMLIGFQMFAESIIATILIVIINYVFAIIMIKIKRGKRK